ncbi:MAG: O-antigen ligase family protein [Elusimicrobia bacterium]|nr:O-antigen ligase family protein [Elusimicrobiota bacterium]
MLKNRYIFAAAALLAVLAAAPYRAFDLDRFFIPKELVLHASALALVLAALRRARTLEADAPVLLLGVYLLLSLAGALFAADHWPAWRALAVTLSSAAVFLAARAEAAEGGRGAVTAAAAAAAVLAAALSLAQAYGLHSAFFSLNRVPGGTLGNRNFAAHLAAVCLPALALAALRAKSRWHAAAGAAGMAALAAALVLTRSRTALLALGTGLGVLGWGLWRTRAAWEGFRLKLLGGAAAAGVLAALLLPNTLEWKSRSPYLDTVTGVANYRTGSGRGRLLQYGRSLRIAAAHPLLGAGPGNWGVVYPDYVDGFDPSLDYVYGRTLNPWPSSDWVAVLSERGLPALAALLLLFAALFRAAWLRAAGTENPAAILENCTLVAVLASAAVAGCFDAFLLLPAQALIFWGLAGALSAPSPAPRVIRFAPDFKRRAATVVCLVWGLALLRSAAQLAAMAVYSGARGASQVGVAALLDPDNTRIRYRLDVLRGRRRPAPRPAAAEPAAREDAPESPDGPEPGDAGPTEAPAARP